MTTFSSWLNVRSDVINSRGGKTSEEMLKKQIEIIFFILEDVSPIYDTVSPKQKRKQYLEAFGSFSGDNLFYFWSTLPPKRYIMFEICHILCEYAWPTDLVSKCSLENIQEEELKAQLSDN